MVVVVVCHIVCMYYVCINKKLNGLYEISDSLSDLTEIGNPVPPNATGIHCCFLSSVIIMMVHVNRLYILNIIINTLIYLMKNRTHNQQRLTIVAD